MTQHDSTLSPMPQATIPPVDKQHGVLALGCWSFAGAAWGGQEDANSLAAMQAAFDAGMNHFDTAFGYGAGKSEKLVGRFIADKRDNVFLATKGNVHGEGDFGKKIIDSLDKSLDNLQVDCVDLYYIHWPRKGMDMKPVLEALEQARSDGKLKAIGVSNFSVEQMEDVSSVAKIDANQLCYSLLWREHERDEIAYCRENGISVVTYSSIAQGILTGKFGKERPTFPQGDARDKMVLFDPEVWPHVADGVERMVQLVGREGQPLVNLAIQWVARQAGVTSVLLGARNTEQATQNAAAMAQPVSDATIAELTAISDGVLQHLPDAGNIFRYYP